MQRTTPLVTPSNVRQDHNVFYRKFNVSGPRATRYQHVSLCPWRPLHVIRCGVEGATSASMSKNPAPMHNVLRRRDANHKSQRSKMQKITDVAWMHMLWVHGISLAAAGRIIKRICSEVRLFLFSRWDTLVYRLHSGCLFITKYLTTTGFTNVSL